MKSKPPLVFSSKIGSPGVRAAACADKAVASNRKAHDIDRIPLKPWVLSLKIIISLGILDAC